MTKLSITLRLGRRRSKTQESSTTDSRNSADSDGGQGRPRGATSVVSSSSGAGSEIQTRARSGTGLSFNEDDSGEVDSVRTMASFISLFNVICLVVTFRGRSYLKVIIAVVCMYTLCFSYVLLMLKFWCSHFETIFTSAPVSALMRAFPQAIVWNAYFFIVDLWWIRLPGSYYGCQ